MAYGKYLIKKRQNAAEKVKYQPSLAGVRTSGHLRQAISKAICAKQMSIRL
jgi:hypothetical protein